MMILNEQFKKVSRELSCREAIKAKTPTGWENYTYENLLKDALSVAGWLKEEGIQFYQERSTDYGEKLDLAEKRLKAFQQKWNIIDLKSQNESNIRLLADLNQKLNDIEISNDEAQSSISMLRRSLNENKLNSDIVSR